jgi:hypothetical protein
LKVNRSFWRPYRLHLKNLRVSHARNQQDQKKLVIGFFASALLGVLWARKTEAGVHRTTQGYIPNQLVRRLYIRKYMIIIVEHNSAELYKSDWARFGPAISQAVSNTAAAGFEPRSDHVGFVVEKVTLGQVFSEYFGFPCQFSFHILLYTHHLSSGAGTIGQLVAAVLSGLSLTPPQETKKVHFYYLTVLKCLPLVLDIWAKLFKFTCRKIALVLGLYCGRMQLSVTNHMQNFIQHLFSILT